MLKKEIRDRKLQSDDIDVNNILDLVLLSEELFIPPTAIVNAVKIVGPSRSEVIAHLRSEQRFELKGASVPKTPLWILVDDY